MRRDQEDRERSRCPAGGTSAPLRMWVNVHIEDAVLPIEVGEGRQRLQWLATAACIRYGLLQSACTRPPWVLSVEER